MREIVPERLWVRLLSRAVAERSQHAPTEGKIVQFTCARRSLRNKDEKYALSEGYGLSGRVARVAEIL